MYTQNQLNCCIKIYWIFMLSIKSIMGLYTVLFLPKYPALVEYHQDSFHRKLVYSYGKTWFSPTSTWLTDKILGMLCSFLPCSPCSVKGKPNWDSQLWKAHVELWFNWFSHLIFQYVWFFLRALKSRNTHFAIEEIIVCWITAVLCATQAS